MKRPRQRFRDEQSIIDKIDAVKALMLAECKSAEELDASADQNFQWCSRRNPDTIRGKERDEYAARCDAATNERKEATRLRNHQATLTGKLLALKKTLQVFNTVPMKFLPDPSVQLQ